MQVNAKSGLGSAGCERGCRRKACRIRVADANQRHDRVHVRADRRETFPALGPHRNGDAAEIAILRRRTRGGVERFDQQSQTRAIAILPEHERGDRRRSRNEARANERPSRNIEVRRRRRATNLGESCLAKARPSVVGMSSATLESAPNARNAASPARMSGPRSSGGPPAGLSASKTDDSDKIKADRSVRAQIRRARVGRGAIRRTFACEVRGGSAGASLDVAAAPARRKLIAGGDTFSWKGRPSESGPRARGGARKAARIASFCACHKSTWRRNSGSSRSLASNAIGLPAQALVDIGVRIRRCEPLRHLMTRRYGAPRHAESRSFSTPAHRCRASRSRARSSRS